MGSNNLLVPTPTVWWPPPDAVQILEACVANEETSDRHRTLLDRLCTAICPGWIILARDMPWDASPLFGPAPEMVPEVAELFKHGWTVAREYPFPTRIPGTFFLPAEPQAVLQGCFSGPYLQTAQMISTQEGATATLVLNDQYVAAISAHTLHGAVLRLWLNLVHLHEVQALGALRRGGGEA